MLIAEDLYEIDWKAYLQYDKDSGVFTWITARGSMKAGSVAGTHDKDGYVRIRLKGISVGAHRLAYWWITGNWPERVIDHIDRVRDNNRFNNLRDVSISENTLNTGISTKSSTGIKNVTWNTNSKCYRVEIQRHDKRIHAGSFRNIEDAIKARDRLNKEFYE